MYLKKIILFFFMLLSHEIWSQKFSIDIEIMKLDSLIEYNQFEDAEKKVEILEQLFESKYNSKQYLKQKLTVQFIRGKLMDNQYSHRDALPLFIDVLQKANENKFYKLASKISIAIAFNQEKAKNFDIAYDYLLKAHKLSKDHHFEDLYSAIYIRYTLLHRFALINQIQPKQLKHIYDLGFKENIDTAYSYINKAINFAEKHKNDYDLAEAYTTIGILYFQEKKYHESNLYMKKTIPYYKRVNFIDFLSLMYLNISSTHRILNQLDSARIYLDSSYLYYDRVSDYNKYYLSEEKAIIHAKFNEMDSAYHYQRIATRDSHKMYMATSEAENKKMEEQFQNEKKEALLKSKNQQLLFVIILLVVIISATFLIILRNRKINKQKTQISKQLIELTNVLEQKQLLLSELQHRVKNNLQHVISILEIQKESVSFNNIDELIRENQNRIHSMALLHKKLNSTDNVNTVNLPAYLNELTDLVLNSYNGSSKNISIFINCQVETISLEKALPIGLIVVELVSNSIKHAFKKQKIGIINIDFAKDETTNKNNLFYSDNGCGYDFDKVSKKGLGVEILKGLIDQLDGETEARAKNGFELFIIF